ncbi:MAG: ion transporter [SAR324 cluster bacterium]|nr:ion transporter [SAR324 cluster bacterium]
MPRKKTKIDSLKHFVNGDFFGYFILLVIIINSVLIGIETYHTDQWIVIVQTTCLYIFVAELLLKYLTKDSNRAFFTSGWNIFDIIIVASAFVPAVSSVSTILRILRVFRVFRMIRAVPELKLMVSVLVRSFSSLGYVALLLGIFFYIYAIIGVELFGKDFQEFATLKEASFSLFTSLTLEGWADLRHAAVAKYGFWMPTLYHVSWVIISAFLMFNLVVGAIINNYQVVDDKEKSVRELPNDFSAEELLQIRNLVTELDRLLNRRGTPPVHVRNYLSSQMGFPEPTHDHTSVCPHCGQTYHIRNKMAGKQATCRKCKMKFTLDPG